MVYQLRDDILDVTAVDNQLGKPAGQDLAEGIYNLPTLFALRDPVVGDELREILGDALNDDERERARKLVVATDGIAQTVLAAQSFLDTAEQALAEGRRPRAARRILVADRSLLDDLPTY